MAASNADEGHMMVSTALGQINTETMEAIRLNISQRFLLPLFLILRSVIGECYQNYRHLLSAALTPVDATIIYKPY